MINYVNQLQSDFAIIVQDTQKLVDVVNHFTLWLFLCLKISVLGQKVAKSATWYENYFTVSTRNPFLLTSMQIFMFLTLKMTELCPFPWKWQFWAEMVTKIFLNCHFYAKMVTCYENLFTVSTKKTFLLISMQNFIS